MICPHCHQKISNGHAKCPLCGHPVPQQPLEDNPQLGKGMKVFIAVGLVLLGAFGVINFVNHQNDPDYTRTPSYLEPDSNLVERLAAPEDVVTVDTAAADSIEKLEKEEAKKVYNSIRRSHRDAPTSDDEQGGEGETESESGNADNPAGANAPSTSAPSAPSPKVETIGNE